MKFIDIDSNSNKIRINAIQCHEAWKDAMEKWRTYKGSMMWRTVSGTDYLIHQSAKTQIGESPIFNKPEMGSNTISGA